MLRERRTTPAWLLRLRDSVDAPALRCRDCVALSLWGLIPLAVAAYLFYEWVFADAELTWLAVCISVAAYAVIRLFCRLMQFSILRSAGLFRSKQATDGDAAPDG